ncbi:MAG: hypothetical protein ACI8RE_002355 [Ilumatobacter sp.]
MTPTEGPTVRANAFVHAVRWAEHTSVWSLLSEAGRTTALSVGISNGLDRVTAARIRDQVSDPVELEVFLTRLLGGIRRDLRSVDIDQLEVGDVAFAANKSSATVGLTNPSTIPGTTHWSAGELEMSVGVDGEWFVDRLVPRVAGP